MGLLSQTARSLTTEDIASATAGDLLRLFVICQYTFCDAFGDYAFIEKGVYGSGHCYHSMFFAGFDYAPQEEAAFPSYDILCGMGNDQYFAG